MNQNQPQSHLESPLLLMDAAPPLRPGYWRRLGRAALDLGLWRSIVLASAALAAVVYCLLHALAPPEPVPEPFVFPNNASWVTTTATQQSGGCFRLDLYVPSKFVNAWITLATNGGFEVAANGSSCARFLLWRRTYSFQTSLTEGGQRLNTEDPAITLTFPRAYQWSDHDNAELPIWVDLTPFLHLGHNALCVEVETSTTTPALILAGEVTLNTGEKIPIRSSAAWVAEPVPKAVTEEYSWLYPETPISSWSYARELPWRRDFWRLVPPGAYKEPFRGQRIRSVATDSTTWIEQDVDLADRPTEGFLRVATDTPYQLWINNLPVQPIARNSSVLGFGPWVNRGIGRSPMDISLETLDDRLDSSEVATLLPGEQKENPPRRDPAVNNFSPDQTAVSGTANQPTTTGNAGSGGSLRRSKPGAIPENPERIVPPDLGQDRRKMEFLAYKITPLLHKGKNTIRIGLYKDEPEAAGLSHPPFLAFDGGTQLASGLDASFASGKDSRFCSGPMPDSNSHWKPALVDGPIEPSLLPKKQIFGYASASQPWFSFSVALFFVSCGVLLVRTPRSPRLAGLLAKGQAPCAILAGWIGAGLLLRASMLERSEAMFGRFPGALFVLAIVGVGGAALAVLLQRRYRRRENQPAAPRERPKHNWVWGWAVGMTLALCFVLRAWRCDYQPPDEDEYVSIQASLAIAKKGVPEFQEGVWYTRSPAYHYLAGAVAAVSDGNIYALRLLSVCFSCATALLFWAVAKELTGNRFLALCALVLLVVHPYEVFYGHVARFYEQQQFFHLLGLYFFLRGFVLNSGMRDRHLTILVYLVAVLSQEITALQAIPLAICYLLFAQRRSWPDEIRILVAAGCALALIGLDYAFFKIRCLTALDGISPRVDAMIGWSFDKPINFFSLLVGYSRLHIVLSAFLLPGFVLAWRRKKVIWTCLYIYLFVSIVVVNLLITSKGFRFEYYLIPLWILLCVHGLAECAKLLIPAPESVPARATLVVGCLAIVICAWSPWRMLASYGVSLQGDPTRAARYVAANLRSGDKVAISELYPQVALLETGRCDYDLAIPILYDFALRKRGKLVDRNAAAEVIGNLDELQRAFTNNERLWIVFDREQMHAHGADIHWEYSAARVQLYLRNNARLVFRSHLWSVYLWDRNVGHYSTFREKPGNWFE